MDAILDYVAITFVQPKVLGFVNPKFGYGGLREMHIDVFKFGVLAFGEDTLTGSD